MSPNWKPLIRQRQWLHRQELSAPGQGRNLLRTLGDPVTDDEVAAHEQAVSHHYIVHYPPHPARKNDPHYVDFEHYHREHRAAARCWIGERIGFEDCCDDHGRPCPPPEGDGEQPSLELHHSVIEFSLQNGVSLAALEKDYRGVSDAASVGEWVESAESNLRWLCCHHHRGPAGAHTASHSDWTASAYVQGLITGE